jgi:hypothetical protein
MEFVPQFRLPLFGKLGRTEHSQPRHLTTVNQLTCNQASFNGFANADIVRD